MSGWSFGDQQEIAADTPNLVNLVELAKQDHVLEYAFYEAADEALTRAYAAYGGNAAASSGAVQNHDHQRAGEEHGGCASTDSGTYRGNDVRLPKPLLLLAKRLHVPTRDRRSRRRASLGGAGDATCRGQRFGGLLLGSWERWETPVGDLPQRVVVPISALSRRSVRRAWDFGEEPLRIGFGWQSPAAWTRLGAGSFVGCTGVKTMKTLLHTTAEALAETKAPAGTVDSSVAV